MKVTVTRADIEAGREHFNDICGCPIWRALARRLQVHGDLGVPHLNEAAVGRIKFRLPRQAVRFQERGIAGKPVKPFTFHTQPQVG